MTSRKGALLVLLFTIAALAARPGATADPPAAPKGGAAQVTINNFTFKPATITVPAGTTVTWTNRDDMPHTVVADDRSFRSVALDTDESFAHTFTAPGTYPYFCSIHASMVGKVIVTKP